MAELTVVAAGARTLLELAVSRGASREQLLERSRIDPDVLEDRENRVEFSKYVALMRAAQDLCKDPAFALRFGEFVDGNQISIVCALGGFDNMSDALAQLNHYASLGIEVEAAANGDRYRLDHRGGQLWIVDARRNPNDFPELTESSFARVVCSMRRTFGDVKFFKEMHFTHAEPGYRAEYDRIFRVPMVFESGENAMRIDEALVAMFRPRQPSNLVTSVLKEHADVLLEKLQSSKSTRSRVEDLLVNLLPSGAVGIDAIACKLGLSRQTLFRKLKAEGVTFEQVLDELRFSMAHDYLDVRNLSVKETAYQLGFSDPTAFSRAFKRWTGRTPSIARRPRPSRGARESALPRQSRRA
jgi:AraC-like DNA-binding protein